MHNTVIVAGLEKPESPSGMVGNALQQPIGVEKNRNPHHRDQDQQRRDIQWQLLAGKKIQGAGDHNEDQRDFNSHGCGFRELR